MEEKTGRGWGQRRGGRSFKEERKVKGVVSGDKDKRVPTGLANTEPTWGPRKCSSN